ncbi:MAG: hypothetical protein KDJ65_36040 [Anaerolineae bacterium]|nr:hypothetical protein [Anaerolineae bacterium]
MTRAEIEGLIAESIGELFDKDLFLLKEDVSERAITHKLAEYIQIRITNLNVDCEYNRDVTKGSGSPKAVNMLRRPTQAELKKAIDLEDIEQLLETSTYPDIIVHRRGSNDVNLLVIEVKKTKSSVNHEHDYQKLKAFTENTENNSYNFTHGIFILFETGCEHPKAPNLKWFSRGEEERTT